MRVIPREELYLFVMTAHITDEIKAYAAGFLDGDGCIMFQNVFRKDYVYGYQIRASIVFYQKTIHRQHLEWLHRIFRYGYVRDRNDGMSEYTIVGLEAVNNVLSLLKPYLRLKKSHSVLANKILRLLPKHTRVNPALLVKAAKLVDQFQQLNYSKKRTNTSRVVIDFLQANKLIPRND